MNRVRAELLGFVAALAFSGAVSGDAVDNQLTYAYEVFLKEDPEGAHSAGIWLKLANIRLRQSRYEEARAAYRRVVSLSPDQGGIGMMLAGRLGVGLSYSGEERYAEAEQALMTAVAQAADEPVRGNLVTIHRELANVGLHTGNFTHVIRHAKAARRAYRTLGRWEDEAVMLLVIGVAHAEIGALEDAASALRGSFDLFSTRGADDVAHREQAARVTRIARGYGIDGTDWSLSDRAPSAVSPTVDAPDAVTSTHELSVEDRHEEQRQQAGDAQSPDD